MNTEIISEPDLRKRCGNAPLSRLYCIRCNKINIIECRTDTSYLFIQHLKCVCGDTWAVCSVCPNVKSHIVLPIQLRRHLNKHRNDNCQPDLPNKRQKKVNKDLLCFNNWFDRTESSDFFKYELNEKGMMFLLAKAHGIPESNVSS